MASVLRRLIIVLVLAGLTMAGGCISCIPQYVAPPEGPVSACYPVGHDPYVPLDHNPSMLNPWDVLRSVFAPMLYGPPR